MAPEQAIRVQRKDVMATADQVKALIRSHAEGDNTRFYAIAMQVAELSKLMSADQTERTAAAQRMEAAANAAAKEAKLAGQRALAAREVIQNVADQCARAGVPDVVIDSLRNIAGPATDMGEGGMPAARRGGR
jgi:hypothetical protein